MAHMGRGSRKQALLWKGKACGGHTTPGDSLRPGASLESAVPDSPPGLGPTRGGSRCGQQGALELHARVCAHGCAPCGW